MVSAVSTSAFLDTVSGELAFFKGVAHARPAGAHRFFHVIAIRSTIRAETGQEVSIEDLWTKLGKYYDLQYFDSNVCVAMFPTPKPRVYSAFK
jgi:MRG-binding protein